MDSTQRCSIDKDSEAPENLRPALTSDLRGLSVRALAPLWTPVFPLVAAWNRDDSRQEKGHRMSFLQRHLNAIPSYLKCFSDVPVICRPSSESLSWPGSSPSALLSPAHLTGLPLVLGLYSCPLQSCKPVTFSALTRPLSHSASLQGCFYLSICPSLNSLSQGVLPDRPVEQADKDICKYLKVGKCSILISCYYDDHYYYRSIRGPSKLWRH